MQPKSADGRSPGQLHYENLCMKAVNQSIGKQPCVYECVGLSSDIRELQGKVIDTVNGTTGRTIGSANCAPVVASLWIRAWTLDWSTQ